MIIICYLLSYEYTLHFFRYFIYLLYDSIIIFVNIIIFLIYKKLLMNIIDIIN